MAQRAYIPAKEKGASCGIVIAFACNASPIETNAATITPALKNQEENRDYHKARKGF